MNPRIKLDKLPKRCFDTETGRLLPQFRAMTFASFRKIAFGDRDPERDTSNRKPFRSRTLREQARAAAKKIGGTYRATGVPQLIHGGE